MLNEKEVTPLDPYLIQSVTDQLCRDRFSIFVETAYRIMHDAALMRNWHITSIAYQLEMMAYHDLRRLIITMPPRTMKSFIASVCYPAWLLGKNPSVKVICVSYAQDLSMDFGAQTLKLMQSPWYRRVFPNTHLDPRSANKRHLRTTRGGYRYATSTGGTLTGRGADFIIIDDPIKAGDANSEVVRDHCEKWFRSTVLSRFNNPRKGRILIVAQRLHMEDLPGLLIDQGGWRELCLPLVAWQDQEIMISRDCYIDYRAGDLLHEERFDSDYIPDLHRDMGERAFEAQFNQRPMPPGGALFKLEWLQRYDALPSRSKIQMIIQSWDTAYEVKGDNDYSVCTTWAVCGDDFYLIDVLRERLEFHALEKAVYAQRHRWKADIVVVEKAGSGISLLQNIRQGKQNQWLQPKDPMGSKQDRASQQTPKFERGQIWVPQQADWLEVFLKELASFPHAKHDDQVDSATQFLASLDTGGIPRLLRQVGRYQG